MKTVLITGAAGVVAGHLREQLAGRYQLRLSDITPIAELREGERFVTADVRDMDQLHAAVQGVDAVIHLGAIPVEDDWEPILQANIIGTHNLYEAARQAQVPRVVFASSNHAMGFYPREQTIPVDVTVQPDSRYGLSKAFGEALASLYANKYGVQSLCIRIGNVWEEPVDRRRLSIWLSPRDLGQLVTIGIEHPDIVCEIVYGMSDNQRAWWDNSNATRLGYKPQDRSEDYAEAIFARTHEPGDTLAERMQGGDFVVAEKGGDPNKEPA
ncbi:MAG: uronate dehydrogenase [Gammaproteobacteria bacterium]